MFDHGADPVIVEKYNVPPYPPGWCFCASFNPIALRKAKIVYSFGLSECNRVK